MPTPIDNQDAVLTTGRRPSHARVEVNVETNTHPLPSYTLLRSSSGPLPLVGSLTSGAPGSVDSVTTPVGPGTSRMASLATSGELRPPRVGTPLGQDPHTMSTERELRIFGAPDNNGNGPLLGQLWWSAGVESNGEIDITMDDPVPDTQQAPSFEPTGREYKPYASQYPSGRDAEYPARLSVGYRTWAAARHKWLASVEASGLGTNGFGARMVTFSLYDLDSYGEPETLIVKLEMTMAMEPLDEDDVVAAMSVP